MRLFIGMSLDSESAAALSRLREKFEPGSGPDLRWSAPQGWHVTLQFLGSVTGERAVCAVEQLNKIDAAPVPLCIEGLGFFDRAGVFWAGVALTPELLALQQCVTAAMRNCGFSSEDRPYSPHITLARAKGRSGAKALAPLKAALEKSKARLHADCTAREFLLYESFPGPEGSRYEVRARFPLMTSPRP